MDVISGSTTRGGAKAALALVKAVRSGVIIGITPDGPKGPAYKVSPGIVTIAKLVQADIIPVRAFLPFPTQFLIQYRMKI
eukprot:gene16836-17018_t